MHSEIFFQRFGNAFRKFSEMHLQRFEGCSQKFLRDAFRKS